MADSAARMFEELMEAERQARIKAALPPPPPKNSSLRWGRLRKNMSSVAERTAAAIEMVCTLDDTRVLVTKEDAMRCARLHGVLRMREQVAAEPWAGAAPGPSTVLASDIPGPAMVAALDFVTALGDAPLVR